MIKFYKDKKRIIFGFLFFVSILPFFLPRSNAENTKISKEELYNPKLFYINSLDKAVHYIDSIYSTSNRTEFDTSEYVQIVSRFTKERFYYGLSHYTVSENWIAALSGKFLWSHLSAIVDPEDILKHTEGLCSQQTIVFMELLKKKKINVRSVGLGFKEGPGHFLCEVYYKGSWRLHDVTLEPQWLKVENIHKSMDYYLLNKDSLYIVYESRLDKKVFDKITEKVLYGETGEFPAKKMLLFHQLTFLFTYLFPLIFLGVFVFSFLNKRNNEQVVLSQKDVKIVSEISGKTVPGVVEQTV